MRDAFSRLESSPKAKGRRQSWGEVRFTRECRNFSRPQKELHRELVVGSTSDPLVERLGWSLGEIRSQWN